MKRSASTLLALALVLGFSIGDSPAGREPETVVARTSTSEPTATLRSAARAEHSAIASSPSADSRHHDAASALPARIRIPAVDVTGPIRPVGMSDAATMEVPEDIAVVGWFDRSVLPSSGVGHTVLVGHRDGEEDPNGVFRRLADLRPGDAIKIHDLSGRLIRYDVIDVELLDRRQFARSADRIFQTSGTHRLVLLTCGGRFDEALGGYQANVVVTAEPA